MQIFNKRYMTKKEKLDRPCAQKRWTVEGRAGGKNVRKEKDRQVIKRK